MTPVDVVVGAEAVVGRNLTPFELSLVKSVYSKGLSLATLWDELFVVLDVKPKDIVKQTVSLRLKAGGADYEATARAVREDAETRIKRAGWVS